MGATSRHRGRTRATARRGVVAHGAGDGTPCAGTWASAGVRGAASAVAGGRILGRGSVCGGGRYLDGVLREAGAAAQVQGDFGLRAWVREEGPALVLVSSVSSCYGLQFAVLVERECVSIPRCAADDPVATTAHQGARDSVAPFPTAPDGTPEDECTSVVVCALVPKEQALHVYWRCSRDRRRGARWFGPRGRSVLSTLADRHEYRSPSEADWTRQQHTDKEPVSQRQLFAHHVPPRHDFTPKQVLKVDGLLQILRLSQRCA
jgi:hypothetical protein